MATEDESTILTKRKRPPARSGHIAVCAGQYMLVWGGYNDRDFSGNPNFVYEERYMDPTNVWIYDATTELWYCKTTDGETPPPSSGSAAVVNDNKLYIIGGHTNEGNINEVYELDLCTWSWSLLDVPDKRQQMSPRDKHAAWFCNNKIYVFGGYGPSLEGYLSDRGQFTLDSGPYADRGWNDQLLTFDVPTRSWSICSCTGSSPNERAAHGTAVIGDHVYLFGGRHGSSRLNDLYCFNMSDQRWSGRLLVTGDQPEGRSWHSFTPISNRHIFMYGGYSTSGMPLSDAWLLDVVTLEWHRLLNISNNNPRLWHKACYTPDKDLLIFGGCSNDILSNNISSRHTDSLLTFRFCPKSLLRLSLDSAFTHRQRLQAEYESLPHSLYMKLQHKMQSAGDNCEEESSDDKAKTCVIS